MAKSNQEDVLLLWFYNYPLGFDHENFQINLSYLEDPACTAKIKHFIQQLQKCPWDTDAPSHPPGVSYYAQVIGQEWWSKEIMQTT